MRTLSQAVIARVNETVWALSTSTSTEQEKSAAISALTDLINEGNSVGLWYLDTTGTGLSSINQKLEAIQSQISDFARAVDSVGQTTASGFETIDKSVAAHFSEMDKQFNKMNQLVSDEANVTRTKCGDIHTDVTNVANAMLKDANLVAYVEACENKLLRQMELLKAAIAEESATLVRRGSQLAENQALYTNLVETVNANMADLKQASYQLSQVSMSAERYTSLITNVISISEFLDVVKHQLNDMADHYNHIMSDWSSTKEDMSAALAEIRHLSKVSTAMEAVNDSLSNILHIVDQVQFSKLHFSKEDF